MERNATTDAGYVLGTNPPEQARLQQQSFVWRSDSAWLFDQIDIQPGWRVIDVGCGPQGVLDLMSSQVGPEGSVVGLEQNPTHAEMANRFCQESGLANVAIVIGDAARSGLPNESFDLVHERAVLVTIPNPEPVLNTMIDMARPGGVVACDDLDQSTRVCDPPHPAWDLLNGLILETWRASGSDPFFGRRLPGLLRRAGLTDVNVRLLPPELWDIDHPRRFQILTFVDNLRERMLASGAITDEELDGHKAALRVHLEDPLTTAVSGLRYQVWGKRSTATR